jgi:Domain of unknown function (DUF4159)
MRGIRVQLWTVAFALLATMSTTAAGAKAQTGRTQDRARWQIARLHYSGGGDWYANPSSLPNLHEELARRLGIAVAEREAVVTLDDERLFGYPMLYVTGHGTFRLSSPDLSRLRRYLDAGGMLWVDDNYGIDSSFRAAIAKLYPDRRLLPLGSEHPIYSAYYDLPGLPKIHEHDGDPAQGFGILDGEHLAVFYTWSSDIGDGLEDAAVHNDPPQAREAAMKMAINVCVFALTQP